jgi:hypothetical protein
MVQLRQQIASIVKGFPIAVKIVLRRLTEDCCQETLRMAGDVVERQVALALGRLPPTQRDEPA